MGNKTAKAKEKKCARETDQNRFPHPAPPQKKNNAKFWLVRMREKQKKLFNDVRVVRKYAFFCKTHF